MNGRGISAMKPRSALSLAVVFASMLVSLTACESLSTRVHNKEDLLAAAGFDTHPAMTPRREAELKSLPPHKFVRRVKGDHIEYFYADTLVCNCLYTGDQKAFDNYKREVFERRIADEQQLTAETYQESTDWWSGWDWGPWGAGPDWW